MERMEMVEKIRSQADISVEEARDVLERNNWDILDAMVELERAGKISGGAEASSKNKEPEYVFVTPTVSGKEESKERRESKKQDLKNKLKRAFRVLIDNKFVVKNRNGKTILYLPVIIPIICAILAIWLTAIVLIVGLFLGLRYSFEGAEFGKKTVNDGMSKMSDYTQDIVNNITGKESSENEGSEKEISSENEDSQNKDV